MGEPARGRAIQLLAWAGRCRRNIASSVPASGASSASIARCWPARPVRHPRYLLAIWGCDARSAQGRAVATRCSESGAATRQPNRDAPSQSTAVCATARRGCTPASALRRPAAPGGRPLVARASEFALVSITLDPLPAQALRRSGQSRASSKRWAGCCAAIRAMDASCRLDGSTSPCCCPGVGLATAHSRMEGLRRQCATQIVMVDGQGTRVPACRWGGQHPHPHSARKSCCRLPKRRWQKPGAVAVTFTITLASVRFEPVSASSYRDIRGLSR